MLALDMGLGKTVSTLTAIVDLLDSIDVRKVLVIAPKRVASDTWPKEIRTWAHTNGLSYVVVPDNKMFEASAVKVPLSDEKFEYRIKYHRDFVGPRNRVRVGRWGWVDPGDRASRKAHNRKSARVAKNTVRGVRGRAIAAYDADITFLNRENVDWFVHANVKAWPFDLVVIDESSSFKSQSSNRFRALTKVLSQIVRIVELTGTPAPNGLLDLWSQIFLLDQGERLGAPYSAFRERYFYSDYMKYTWFLKDGAEDAILSKLSDICMSMSAEDYLDLPPMINNTLSVTLSDAVMIEYRELEKEFVLAIQNETITAANAGVLTNKLQQIAGGSIYNEDRIAIPLHDGKLDALEEIVAEANGAPVLVGYWYQSDLERIRTRFPKAPDLKTADIDRWNKGEIPVMLAHPASCGHGLNLQHGGHIVAWFNLPWSLELYQQLIERVGPARQAQSGYDRPVFVHHIVAIDTIDEDIMAAQIDKDATQQRVLDAIKAGVARRS